MKEKHSINYMRRTVGILICSLPIILLVLSIVTGLICSEQHPFSAIGFMITALFVGVFNFYLSFIRPIRLQRKHGSLEGISHISGIPLVGTILTILGCVFGFGAIGTALLGVLVLALDTGGIPWFIFSTWYDSSFWDAPR